MYRSIDGNVAAIAYEYKIGIAYARKEASVQSLMKGAVPSNYGIGNGSAKGKGEGDGDGEGEGEAR